MRIAAAQLKLWGVLLVLVVAHFALRPTLADSRFAPDLVLVALLLFAIRSRPGAGAAAGFVVGLLSDAVAPTAFGAGALALTVIGYLAGWLKAVVFADNLLVNALFIFGASWLRDLLEILASGTLRRGAVGAQLLVWSPVAAATTAAAGLLALIVFRRWLRVAPSR
jgi:rod shape-determining protein MreD